MTARPYNLERRTARCLACNVAIGPNDMIVTKEGDEIIQYNLCIRHRRRVATFLKNTGLVDQALIPVPKLRLAE